MKCFCLHKSNWNTHPWSISYLCRGQLNCQLVEVVSQVPYLGCRCGSHPEMSRFEVYCQQQQAETAGSICASAGAQPAKSWSTVYPPVSLCCSWEPQPPDRTSLLPWMRKKDLNLFYFQSHFVFKPLIVTKEEAVKTQGPSRHDWLYLWRLSDPPGMEKTLQQARLWFTLI